MLVFRNDQICIYRYEMLNVGDVLPFRVVSLTNQTLAEIKCLRLPSKMSLTNLLCPFELK